MALGGSVECRLMEGARRQLLAFEKAHPHAVLRIRREDLAAAE